MITHIARLGKIIGQYSPEDLAKGLADGSVKDGDHWWRPGMKDWKLVSSETPLMQVEKKAEAPAKQTEADWRTRPKHRASQYGDVPATEKQLALIKNAGLTDVSGLTKYDASRWIDLILGSEEGVNALNEGQVTAMEEQRTKNAEAGLGCGGHRTPSGQYRDEIKYSENAIEEKMREVQQAVKDDPDDAESELANLETEKKDYQEVIDQQMEMRVDYWIWVIETARNEDEYSSHHELYSEDYLWVEESLAERLSTMARKLASVPSREMVEQTLIKLDTASLTWDDDQPALLLSRLSTG
jgi:hypothetical protein